MPRRRSSDARAVRREKEAAQARFRAAYATSATTDDAEPRPATGSRRSTTSTTRPAGPPARRPGSGLPPRRSVPRSSTSRSRRTRRGSPRRPRRRRASWPARRSRSATSGRTRTRRTPSRPPRPAPWAERPGVAVEDDEPLVAALAAGGTPTIFRLLRGDRDAMTRLVAQLAGTDAAEQKRWQLSIGRLVDADRGGRDRGHVARLPAPTTPSGARSPRRRTARSPRPSRRSATGSTGCRASSTTASRRSATCRSRSATPVSTRCESGTGRPRPRWPPCMPRSRSPPTSTWRRPPATSAWAS